MSESNGHLNFDDLTPSEVAVTLQGQAYILREASAEAARQYRNAIIRSSKLGGEGKKVRVTSVDGVADVEPLLVSLCLFKTVGELRQAVPLPTILQWKSRVVKALFERIKQLSDLDEKDDSEEGSAKNLPSATTTGSGPPTP
jgi:hypothetical protein